MKLLAGLLILIGLAFSKPQIVVENAWVREVPPVSVMSAAFLRIRNTGNEDDILIGVRSDASRIAEIHTTIMKDSMMKMRRLKEVKIPAGGSVEFRPMGKHIMLIDLKKPLKAGDKVKIILIFKKSGKITVEASVKRMNMKMMY